MCAGYLASQASGVRVWGEGAPAGAKPHLAFKTSSNVNVSKLLYPLSTKSPCRANMVWTGGRQRPACVANAGVGRLQRPRPAADVP